MAEPLRHDPEVIDGFDADELDRLQPWLGAAARACRYRVHGLERVTSRGAAIIALGPGAGPLDAALLGAAVRGARDRWVRYAAPSEWLKLWRVGAWLRAAGAVADTHYETRRCLFEGALVGLFTGTSSSGIARVAFKAGVPIVPVAVIAPKPWSAREHRCGESIDPSPGRGECGESAVLRVVSALDAAQHALRAR